MHIMAEISLAPLHRSAVPESCSKNPQHLAVARVEVSFGLGRVAESLWCLPCLDSLDLSSVLPLLNATLASQPGRPDLRVVS